VGVEEEVAEGVEGEVEEEVEEEVGGDRRGLQAVAEAGVVARRQSRWLRPARARRRRAF